MEVKELNKQDLNWAFDLNRITLQLIGIWPNKDSRFLQLQQPIMFIILITFIFLPLTYALFKVFPEFSLVIDNLIAMMVTVGSMLKLLFLWRKRKVYESLIKALINDWMICKMEWERDIMMKHAGRSRKFTFAGCLIMGLSYFGFLIIPLIGIPVRTINNITDPSTDRAFAVQVYYPFDTTKSPIFELTYISHWAAGYVAALALSTPTTFFGALVFHICGQFEILKRKIKHIFFIKKNYGIQGINAVIPFPKVLFRKLIDKHCQLIQFAEDIEYSFHMIILIEIFFLSLAICILGFQVLFVIRSKSEQQNIAQMIILGGTAANFLMHLLILCLSSEVLMHHCMELSCTIYRSAWYLVPNKYARLIIPVMVRSSRPVYLTAGKFIILSNGCFLRIVKSSFGYMSMLLAVSK